MVEKIDICVTMRGKDIHTIFVKPEKILKLISDEETSIGDFLSTIIKYGQPEIVGGELEGD